MRYLFPCFLVLLELGAGFVYYCEGDWRRGSYWTLAAAMTVFITLE